MSVEQEVNCELIIEQLGVARGNKDRGEDPEKIYGNTPTPYGRLPIEEETSRIPNPEFMVISSRTPGGVYNFTVPRICFPNGLLPPQEQ